MRAIARTASGGRDQDRVLVADLGAARLLALADGAGGMSGGTEAAEGALRIVHERLSADADTDLCTLLYDVDDALSAQPCAGETTLAVVLIEGDNLRGVSAGDSGVWLLSTSTTVLTGNQVVKPLVGSGRASAVPFSAQGVAGRVLLASDGLLKFAHPSAIEFVARRVDMMRAVAALLALPCYASGQRPDDTAVILASV